MSQNQPKYVDVSKLDVERIDCFYGSECRLSDVREWLNELPAEEDVVKVVRCSKCVYSDKRPENKCVCLKTNTMHNNTHFCAEGLEPQNVPSWKTVCVEPGNDDVPVQVECPYCKSLYLHPYGKCPNCYNILKIPTLRSGCVQQPAT